MMRTLERGVYGSRHGHRTTALLQAMDTLDAAHPLRYAVPVGICARKGATTSFRPWRSGGSGLCRDRDIAVGRTR